VCPPLIGRDLSRARGVFNAQEFTNAVDSEASMEQGSGVLPGRGDRLEQERPAMWDEFMDELRWHHLGYGSEPAHPSASERLTEAYLAAVQ
jgi:hypothetical protein